MHKIIGIAPPPASSTPEKPEDYYPAIILSQLVQGGCDVEGLFKNNLTELQELAIAIAASLGMTVVPTEKGVVVVPDVESDNGNMFNPLNFKSEIFTDKNISATDLSGGLSREEIFGKHRNGGGNGDDLNDKDSLTSEYPVDLREGNGKDKAED